MDGDLIADIPTDEGMLIDPDSLIFAGAPVENPAVNATAWSDFLTHLEAETGKDGTAASRGKPVAASQIRMVDRVGK